MPSIRPIVHRVYPDAVPVVTFADKASRDVYNLWDERDQRYLSASWYWTIEAAYKAVYEALPSHLRWA